MPSFATLSLIATFAFAGFSSAAPVVGAAVALPVAEAGVVVGRALEVEAGLAHVAEVEIEARHTQEIIAQAVPAIINTATSKVNGVIAPLQQIEGVNATLAAVSPVTGELTNILNEALSAVNALVGKPVDEVLATADGVLSVTDLAGLVAGLLNLVIGVLGKVLSVATTDAQAELKPVLAAVGGLVGELLKVVLGLVGGLLSALLPLVGPVFGILQGLGLGSVLGLLGKAL